MQMIEHIRYNWSPTEIPTVSLNKEVVHRFSIQTFHLNINEK